jgi:hypothetical protein
METKTILVYMPYTWPTISAKVFQSFVEMTGPDIQEELAKQNVKLKILISNTFPLCRNRNQAVEKAMKNDVNSDYIFFADGDQIWPKTTILELLAHVDDQFPVVTGLYWKKTPPHQCVAGFYSGWDKNEPRRAFLEANGFVTPEGQPCLFYTPLKDFDTVQPIEVSGMGCLLVKTDIFKKLSLPYFDYVNCYSTGGDYSIDHCSEEMVFWAQLKKQGIKALVVPSVRCGHVLEKVIGCPEQ